MPFVEIWPSLEDSCAKLTAAIFTCRMFSTVYACIPYWSSCGEITITNDKLMKRSWTENLENLSNLVRARRMVLAGRVLWLTSQVWLMAMAMHTWWKQQKKTTTKKDLATNISGTFAAAGVVFTEWLMIGVARKVSLHNASTGLGESESKWDPCYQPRM